MSVLALGPFLKGLFFWPQLLAATASIAVGFGIWVMGRHFSGMCEPAQSGPIKPLDIIRKDWAGAGLLALAAFYLLQFMWDVYPCGNLDVLLRVAAAYFIYVMVSAESGPGLRRIFSWAVTLTAVAAGAAGYVQYLGVLSKLPERLLTLLPWVQMPGQTVIGSFEYHNATAILVLCGFLLAVGLASDSGRPLPAGLLGGMGTFLALVFFFSQSRGAFVVMPLAILALLAGLDNERRWLGLMITATSALPAMAAVKGIGDAISAHHPMEAACWTAFACLAGCLGGLFVGTPLKMSPRLRCRILCACVVVVVVAAGIAASGGQWKEWLPKQAERYSEIDMEGASSRFRYYADALKVIASSPWGLGGWGWSRVYHGVQAEDYIGREVHSHYLQVAIEAGVLGLAALLASLLALTVRAWKQRGKDGPGWALAAAGLALGAHSAIDFDLSYGFLWFLLWVLFAASARAPARSGAGATPHDDSLIAGSLSEGWPAGWSAPRVSLPCALLGIASLAVALLSGSFFLGSRLVEQLAEIPVGTDKVPVAEQAVKYDPWNTDALLALSTRDGLERAVALDPMNPEPHWQLSLWLEREYDLQGALTEAERALALYPWIPDYYSKVADLEGSFMLEALASADPQDALVHAERVLELQVEVTRRTPVSAHLKSWSPSSVSHALFSLRCGQALFLARSEADAVKPLMDATKSPLIGHEANLWLYVIYERAGDDRAAAALEGVPTVRFRALNPIYEAIKAW